eukprot:Hpha_TRINITY_DN3685_c0_g1::TRINITY_DN3685_c0_g1_i1::g.1041::m.1041
MALVSDAELSPRTRATYRFAALLDDIQAAIKRPPRQEQSKLVPYARMVVATFAGELDPASRYDALLTALHEKMGSRSLCTAVEGITRRAAAAGGGSPASPLSLPMPGGRGSPGASN